MNYFRLRQQGLRMQHILVYSYPSSAYTASTRVVDNNHFVCSNLRPPGPEPLTQTHPPPALCSALAIPVSGRPATSARISNRSLPIMHFHFSPGCRVRSFSGTDILCTETAASDWLWNLMVLLLVNILYAVQGKLNEWGECNGNVPMSRLQKN